MSVERLSHSGLARSINRNRESGNTNCYDVNNNDNNNNNNNGACLGNLTMNDCFLLFDTGG
jgi:hypothetical protein